MKFAFNEEQEALRGAARDFLAEYSSSERIRQAMGTELGYDPDVWRRIGQELGWTSVIIPEQYGGAGLTYVELVALMEEMGGVLLCAPFFSSICLAANALLVAGSEAQRAQWLPPLAAGETTATLAYTGPSGHPGVSGIEAIATRDGEAYVLNGTKGFVLDGHSAATVIVAARASGTSGSDGVSLFIVPGDVAGMERRLLPTMDQTRRQAELTLHDVRIPATSRLGQEGGGGRLLAATLDRAAVALAAEQMGGAQRCLDMAVEYAKERVQFGRPIGSFQAIKHKCADMLLRVESARSASYYAGWAVAAGDAEVPVLAALAKAYCSDAFFFCAAESIQIHGGVGFTWEYDAHLYFKRARAMETFLGDPAYHREAVAGQMGL
jgi:alkylation response protein AidB-like acyl-CoA dehydrogenase